MKGGLGRDVRDADEVSDIDPSTSGLEPLEEDSTEPQERQAKKLFSFVAWFRTGLLLAVTFSGFITSILGIALLGYILLSRSYAPPTAHLAKEMYFDYTQEAAIATASFADAAQYKVRGQPARVVPPGQRMNIWLDLEAAEAHGTVNSDIFQVIGQIISWNGTVAATASRPCLLTYWSPVLQYIRGVVTAPFVLLGLWREHQILKVPLFNRYADQPDKPLIEFRAILKGRDAQGLPHLYSARVHIDLVLGFFGRLLYLGRPGTWSMVLLVLLGLSMAAGGGLAAVLSLAVLLFVGKGGSAPSHSPPRSEADAESEAGDDVLAPGISMGSSPTSSALETEHLLSSPGAVGLGMRKSASDVPLGDSRPSAPVLPSAPFVPAAAVLTQRVTRKLVEE